ncbi:hypothetical protein Lalb_Chr24g0398671 [Lupinus albus]|uniref:Uncharacterized protein n=1 Tax=Lupinus albus TaxID=3870 RepID=A0A6A4N3U3_LUPAL|nr:hypothetical protein Lalb_Chr24g0398671 [Lupinus albus]
MGKKYKIEIHSDKLHGIRAKGSAEMIIEEEAAVGGSMHGVPCIESRPAACSVIDDGQWLYKYE